METPLCTLLRKHKNRIPVRPRWQAVCENVTRWMPEPAKLRDSTELLVYRSIVRVGSSRDFENILRVLGDSTDAGLAVFQGYALNHNTVVVNRDADGEVSSVCTTWVVEWACGDARWSCRLDAVVKHDAVPIFDRKAWAFSLEPLGRADVMFFSVTVRGEKVSLAKLLSSTSQVAWNRKQLAERMLARVEKYFPMRSREVFWNQAEQKIFTHSEVGTLRVGDMWLFADVSIYRNTLRGHEPLRHGEGVSLRFDRVAGLVVDYPPNLYFDYSVELRVAGAAVS